MRLLKNYATMYLQKEIIKTNTDSWIASLHNFSFIVAQVECTLYLE